MNDIVVPNQVPDDVHLRKTEQGIAILVLGMHRSGTSALSGVLNVLGAAIPGELWPANEQNERGYFENKRIVAFHDRLLARFGSRWDDPLQLSLDWIDTPLGRGIRAELRVILEEEFGAEPIFLVKDPRMCRVVPLWLRVLGDMDRTPVPILSLRHPVEVARSLQKRNGFWRAQSLMLWLDHMLAAERFTRGMPRGVVSYEHLLADWRSVLRNLKRDLRLVLPVDLQRVEGQLDDFLSAELRHHSAGAAQLDADDPVQALCTATWDAFGLLAEDPSSGAAQTVLDAGWARMREVSGAVVPLLMAERHLGSTLEQVLRQEIEKAHQEVWTRDASIASLHSIIRARDADIAQRDHDQVVATLRHAADLAQRDQDIGTLRARVQRTEESLTTTRQDAAKVSRAFTASESRNLYLEREISLLQTRLTRREEQLQERIEGLQAVVEELGAGLAEEQAVSGGLHDELDAARAHFANAMHDINVLQAQFDAIRGSTAWRATAPVRHVLEHYPGTVRVGRRALKVAWWSATLQLPAKLRRRKAILNAIALDTPAVPVSAGPEPDPEQEAAERPDPAEATAAEEQPDDEADAVLSADEPAADAADAPPAGAADEPAAEPASVPAADGLKGRHVVFVSGEWRTPGHLYRIVRIAEAARRTGIETTILTLDEVPAEVAALRRADLVFIWRAAWDSHVEQVILEARKAGARVIFDCDDLMFEPGLATIEVIDGIRSQDLTEEQVRQHYLRVQTTMAHADFCTAPTSYMAARMRWSNKVSFVIPNGFDDDVLAQSRLAVRRRQATPSDGLVRIGYASGSKTHQRDFARAADAIAAVLQARPECRLVLFKNGETLVVDIREFPAFDTLADRIEWREMVPLPDLPQELARFDINLAPLEIDNVFCEAKSELKFFEAALVDVPTVASPTAPYRAVVRSGTNGYLADSTEAWRVAVLALVDDPGLRSRVARRALFDVLAAYGPERRTEQVAAVIEQVIGSPRTCARAFELEVLRASRPLTPEPVIPDHTIVFQADRLGLAEVTVVIPLYNYARYILEALESVHDQSLAALDIVVVDDCSRDDGLEVTRTWLVQNQTRFNRVTLVRNVGNSGLGFSRNVGISLAETTFVLCLDADNHLLPTCAQRSLDEIKASSASFAYGIIQTFGDTYERLSHEDFHPARLISGNYIDAMALLRKSAWATVGGYEHVRFGWEDFSFWCKCAEHGLFGLHIPDILAGYRVHQSSMLRSETDQYANKIRLIDFLQDKHPWLRMGRPDRPATPAAAAGDASPLSEPALALRQTAEPQEASLL